MANVRGQIYLQPRVDIQLRAQNGMCILFLEQNKCFEAQKCDNIYRMFWSGHGLKKLGYSVHAQDILQNLSKGTQKWNNQDL